MERKLPSLYQKADRKFYFTFKGKQYYAGSTKESAHQRLHDVVGTGNSDGPHSIKDAVKEYLDSIDGVQSPDSVDDGAFAPWPTSPRSNRSIASRTSIVVLLPCRSVSPNSWKGNGPEWSIEGAVGETD